MKILTAEKAEEARTGRKQPKQIQASAIESLIVTVQRAIQQMTETNAKALDMMNTMVINLGRDLPPPEVSVGAPVVHVPDIVIPPPLDGPRQWRVTVTKRDNRGMIQIVDLERIA